RRRNAGEARDLDGLMAIAAVDAESRDVMLMAERDDLLALNSLIGEVRRADDAADDPQHETGDEHSAENRHARKRICTTVKDLRHVLPRGTGGGCRGSKQRAGLRGPMPIIFKIESDARPCNSNPRNAAADDE